MLNAQTTIRKKFAAYLETELALRGKSPADTLHRAWSDEVEAAILAAMSKSTVLFTKDAVARWMGVNEKRIRRAKYRQNLKNLAQ